MSHFFPPSFDGRYSASSFLPMLQPKLGRVYLDNIVLLAGYMEAFEKRLDNLVDLSGHLGYIQELTGDYWRQEMHRVVMTFATDQMLHVLRLTREMLNEASEHKKTADFLEALDEVYGILVHARVEDKPEFMNTGRFAYLPLEAVQEASAILKTTQEALGRIALFTRTVYHARNVGVLLTDLTDEQQEHMRAAVHGLQEKPDGLPSIASYQGTLPLAIRMSNLLVGEETSGIIRLGVFDQAMIPLEPFCDREGFLMPSKGNSLALQQVGLNVTVNYMEGLLGMGRLGGQMGTVRLS